MGWGSGSELMREIIGAVCNSTIDISNGHRVIDEETLYYLVAAAFMDADCDTLDECLGMSDDFDRALKKLYTELGWDDED